MERPDLNNNRKFSPCTQCSNVLTEECIECIAEMKYRHFKLRPGTGIKDLPSFPLEDVLKESNPSFRLVVFSIYIAAITDYLQYKEEYEFREAHEGGINGKNNDDIRSSRILKNIKVENLLSGAEQEDTSHKNSTECTNP